MFKGNPMNYVEPKTSRISGMDKMQLVVKSPNGEIPSLRYIGNPKTGKLSDFNFKRHSID